VATRCGGRGTALHPGRGRRRHAAGLFDDVVGAGGVLLLASVELRDALTEEETRLLADLRWPVVALAAEPGAELGAGRMADATGAYAGWLAGLGAVAVLIRPDLYVYGAARDGADVAALLGHLRRALRSSYPESARPHRPGQHPEPEVPGR
jgi:hypothetical protein